jgi:hypothetical protein
MVAYAKWFYQRTGGGDLGEAYGPDEGPWGKGTEHVIATMAHIELGQTTAWQQVVGSGFSSWFYHDSLMGGKQLVNSLRVTGLPQVILLKNPDGDDDHAVLVTGYNGYDFTIYDPNFPCNPNAYGDESFPAPYDYDYDPLPCQRYISFNLDNGWGEYEGKYTKFYPYSISSKVRNSDFENIHNNAVSGFIEGNDIIIESPEADEVVTSPVVTISGRVIGDASDATKAVVYNGGLSVSSAIVSNGRFNVDVTLNQDDNIFLILAGTPLTGLRSLPLLAFAQDTAAIAIQIEMRSGKALVTLEWEQDSTDVDLYVHEPDGEVSWWSDRTTATGGFIDRDDTSGYGPEHYTLEWEEHTVECGAYEIRVHYYSDHSTGYDATGTVTIVQYTSDGESSHWQYPFEITYDNSANSDPGDTGSDWADIGTVYFNSC